MSYEIKNAPRGSHCGGVENVAIATRHRRRMSQATFSILLRESQLFALERKQIAIMAEEKSLSQVSHRLFVLNRSEMRKV